MNTTKQDVQLSSLTDEELLRWAYASRNVRTSLELELLARFEHLLDELEARPELPERATDDGNDA